ncbi:MAG: hypothetical protein RIC18_06585 [Hoeflea sp.]|uniref:hypothetical protein n=1 Tax=Hoeflea sp. TaxID=1940281 RepID=UPI0032F07EA8
MFKASKALGLAAIVTYISALIHFATPAMTGFSREVFWLVPVAVLYTLMAYLILPNRRLMAWLAFFILLAGAIAALGASAGSGTVPQTWWAAILAADLVAASLLFVYLWRPKPVTPA